MACLDFDLLFSRSGDRYQAQVVASPAGEGQAARFGAPVSERELARLAGDVGGTRSGQARAAIMTAAKLTGGRLFDSAFADGSGECLRRSLDQARDVQAVLRIRLRLSDVPELGGLPWELMYDRADDRFVALSGGTPVVRYLHLPFRPRAIPVTLPLRILVIRSEPSDWPALGLADEWAQAGSALAGLAEAGLVAVNELPAATLSEFRRALAADSYHVLHFMGHGQFGQPGGGTLLFTDRTGSGVPVTGGDLGVMLADHASLRVAVLNACEAGRADPADPFASVAMALMRRGVPAVIAMQFPISDEASIELAPALYGALAAGWPVDAAVAEARKAIYAVSPLEWATPVLHLRASDARLFAIQDARPSSGVTGSPAVQDARSDERPDGSPAAARSGGVIVGGKNQGIVSTGSHATNVQIR